MSRVSYSDDEDYPGQYGLWQANCNRSVRGAVGQRVMREMEAALLALPSKRLVRGVVALHGEVCAVGAYLAAKKARQDGIAMSQAIDALETECGPQWKQEEDETDARGVKAGMPHLVAWKIVALNDIEGSEGRYVTVEGPTRCYPDYPAYYQMHRNDGVRLFIETTPEERYAQVLAWVRANLTAVQVGTNQTAK